MISLLGYTIALLMLGQPAGAEKKPAPPAAKPPADYDAGKVEAYLRAAAREKGFIGLEVVVWRDGKPSLSLGYGQTALAGGKPLNPDTPLAIGSVSKQFTCAAVLMLAQDGKLSVTDKVAKWYPGLTNADRVTLLDLMNHTSGYPDYYPLDFVDRRMAKTISADDLIQKYAGGKVDFEPGAKYSYSNTGYTILGRVVEKVTNRALGEFLNYRIFRPLGMTSARFEPNYDAPELPKGYRALGIDGNEQAPPEGTGWLNGAGGVWCSANDLAKWALALMEGRVVDKERLEVMTKARLLNNGKKSNYGCGLMVREVNGESLWIHTGSVSGFHANLTMFPRTKSLVITLANAEHLDDSKLHREVVALVQKEAVNIPKVEGPKAVDQAKELVAQLTRGELKGDKLGEEYRLFMTPEKLKAYASKLKELGEPKSVDLGGQSERGGMEVSNLRITFKDGTVLLGSMYRMPDGTVEQFLLTKE